MIWRSLRWLLLAGGAAAMLIALLIAGATLVHLFERHLLRSLAGDLDATLRLVLGALEVGSDGELHLAREPADPRFSEPLSGLYWQIGRAGRGREAEPGGSRGAAILRSRSLWDWTIPLPSDDLTPGAVHHHRIGGPAGRELLASERRVLLEGAGDRADIRVVVAADLGRVAEARQEFAADLIVALTVLGLALGAAMWVQIDLGLKPLETLRENILSVRRARTEKVSYPVPGEVAPLVEEINALLEAQSREMERSRGRAADLAHGLKTPLAALAADARRLRDKGETEIAAGLEEVGETMRRHVERELARARIGASIRKDAQAAIPVRQLLETLVGTLERTPDGRRVSIETAVAGDLAIGMDKADLAEVLGNLLENAARHARKKVVVTGGMKNGVAGLTVEDDGTGVPEADMAAILRRGGRLDSRGGGAGLGLAIVQDVLEAYGRRLELSASPLGGLKASF